ncbi:hypothetical protein HIM_02635 [Hirsutella minnesotensis 3608]|nr:hypothetical protein HIM_02635 [Hirsutella minnesotensis 3608]
MPPIRLDQGPSPSFAQTGAEFIIDDGCYFDDDDDDDMPDGGYSLGPDTYELETRKRPQTSSREIYTDEDEEDEVYIDDDYEYDFDDEDDDDDEDVEDLKPYTTDEDRAVRAKFDRKLVLFVALPYLLSFLDRSNIGNARIAGMDDDLQTDPPRDDWYEWALTAFYVAYVAFGWMALLWKLVPARALVSALVLSWGLVACLQALAPSYPPLVALRFLLGIGEAGLAGVPFYLSFFYRRDELAFRTAIFISAAPLATSFASTLAWAVTKFAEFGPIPPWRLLFLVEGLPSVVLAVVAWSVVPDSPQTARYLSEREKVVAVLRLRDDASSSDSATPASGLRSFDVFAVLTDPITWIAALIFFLSNLAYSSLPVFLPDIIAQMGHSAVSAQALSAPPYLAAFFAVLFTAHVSDRLRVRTAPLLFHALASAFGYAVLALSDSLDLPDALRYLAVYPATVGFFSVVTLIITWNINNQSNQSRQSAGFALMQLVGQCGPIVGTRLCPDEDEPYYTSGMTVCACAMLAVAGLTLVLRMILRRRNRRLDRFDDKTSDGSGNGGRGLVGRYMRLKIMPLENFRYIL